MSKSPQSKSQFLHSHIYLCRRIVPLTKNRNYGEQALGRYLNISHYIFIDKIYWGSNYSLKLVYFANYLSNSDTFSLYHRFLYVISLVCNIVTLK